MLSKILLGMLVALLVSKYGLFTRLKRMRPQLDRAVNITIALLALLYVGHFVWWLVQRSSAP